MPNQKKAYIFALLAVMCWSTVATAFKIALNNASFIQLLFFSSFVSMLVLFLILVLQKKLILLRQIDVKQILISLGLGILNPFLYYVILFKAYSILPAQEAMTLNYTWPVMLILLSIPILKQKLSLKSSLAVMLSFIGIIIISTKANLLNFKFSDFGGDMLALSSSVVWALYWLFNVKDRNDSVVKLFFNFLSGSILSFLLMFFTEGLHVQSAAIPAFIYIGIFEMSLTFVFWLTALKYAESTDKVSQLIFLSPFISLFFIYLIVGEEIHFSTLVGLFFIVTGIIVQQFIKSKTKNIQN